MEQKKYGLAAAAYGTAKLLLARALDNQRRLIIMLLAVGAVAYFSGVWEFDPAFAELSQVVQAPDSVSGTITNSHQQQAPAGNSYHRFISESMSLIASHGSSGANSPSTYYRSVTESLSVTTTQGKANSYSRSMTEQATFSTGMPSSSSVGQQVRASPTAYSASSVQRIDERFNLRNLSGGKVDTTNRDATAGTPVYSTDLVISNPEMSGSKADIIILDTASVDGGEAETGDNSRSAFLHQIDAFNDYVLMQKSIQNAVILEHSVSAVFLIGTFVVAVANQPAVLKGGCMQKRIYSLFLPRVVHDRNAISKKTGNNQVTYVLLVVLVIFTVSSVVKAVDPFAGQAFAAITYVGAGSSSFTSGGSAPSPGLPSGLQNGDVMIAYFYSRETVDGTVSISSGWTPVFNDITSGGLLAVWYRVYQAGDSAPTFTLTNHSGGGGGDTAGAQIAAWRGVDTANPIATTGAIATNGAQQNIGSISGITLNAGETVIVVGGKTDDWTSVATLSGDSLTWVEVGEPDATAGADAGLVWDYAIDGSSGTTVTAKTFSVAGGASATGKGVMLSLNLPPQSFQGNLSDTLGLSESIIAKIARRAVTDNMAISDTVDRAYNVARLMTDQMALAESVSTKPAKIISDGLMMTESISIGVSKSFTDQFVVTDSITKAVSILVSESLNITESASKTFVTSKVVSEQLGVTDSLQRSIITTRTLSEQLTLDESTTRTIVLSRTLLEQLAAEESVSKSFVATLSERMTVTEQMARSFVIIRSVSEQTGLTDAVAKAVATTLIEQMAGQDTLTMTIILTRTVVESLALQDSISKAVSIAMTEQMDVTEMVTRSALQSRPMSEQLGISDAITVSIIKPLSESVGIVDTITRSVVQSISTTEQMAAQDSISLSVAKTLSEQMTMTDLLVRTTTASGSVAEQLGATESIAIMVSKQLADDLALSDSIMTTGSVVVGEPMALTDAIVTSVIITRAISESLALADTTTGAPAMFVAITDSMAIDDSFANISVLFNLYRSEELVMAQSFTTNFTGFFNQPGSEGIVIGDNVTLTIETGETFDVNNHAGNKNTEYARSIVEYMLVSGTTKLGISLETGGKIVIRDVTDSFALSAIQPQTLHQRVITIQNVTVAVNVADVRSATFGTALATLNFEITNKNGENEDLVLRYWYSDPASGTRLYQGERAIMVGAGQTVVRQVEVPFYSEGIFDLIIEVESDDGTIASTDIAVNVPWLEVYLYVIVVIAFAVILISLLYVLFTVRRSKRSLKDER